MHYLEDIGMIKDKIFKVCTLALAAVTISGAVFFADLSPISLEVDAGAVDVAYDMSASYRSGKYYANLQGLDLSGDEARDVLAIAMSQVGYHEGDSKDELDGLGNAGTRDFVEYNVLSGKYDNGQGNGVSYGYYWCASFVNWCLRMAGVDKMASGSEISCERWYGDANQMGIFRSKGGYVPSPGDIIFFRDNGSSRDSTHVGLVRYSDGKNVYTVEGNTSNGSGYSSNGEYVALKQYSLSSSYIVGYATPKYNAGENARRVDYSGNFLSLGDYISTAEVKIYSDTALATESGNVIPVYTVFEVREVADGYLKVNANGVEGYIGVDSPKAQLTTSENIYTVNYVSESGALMYMPQYRRADEQKYIYTNAPTRDNGGFVGWKMQESPGTMFVPGDKLPNSSADMTFVAVFDTNYYIVSFKNQDGTLIDQVYGYYGTEFSFPPAPDAPEGYVFAGWSADSTGVITGNASYTVAFISEDELADAGAGGETESETEGADESASLDYETAELISTIAAGAIMLAIPVALIPILFVKKKKRK